MSPRRNERLAGFRFHAPTQAERQRKLRWLLERPELLAYDCDSSHTDDLLIDANIIGVRHKKVQERLLNEGQSLDLTKSIQIARQFELSQQQLKEMREDAIIANVKSQKPGCKPHRPRENSNSAATSASTRGKKPAAAASGDDPTCGRCGKEATHVRTRGKCPAIGGRCSFCNKLNHWHRVCKKRLASGVCALQADSHKCRTLDSDSVQEDGFTSEDTDHMLSIHTIEPRNRIGGSYHWKLGTAKSGSELTLELDVK